MILKVIFYLAVRDDAKGRETVAKIKEASKNNAVDYFCVELSSLKSVRNFVQDYKKRTNNKKIDIFIQNAGVMVSRSEPGSYRVENSISARLISLNKH